MKVKYTFEEIGKPKSPKFVKANSFEEADELYWDAVNCEECEWTLRITNTATGEYRDYEYCER